MLSLVGDVKAEGFWLLDGLLLLLLLLLLGLLLGDALLPEVVQLGGSLRVSIAGNQSSTLKRG